MSLAPRDERLLAAVLDHIGLQEFTKANDELEKITSIVRDWPEILKVRIQIQEGLKQWALMQATAKTLVEREPGDAASWISWAHATRHAQSVQVARPILLTAIQKHSDVWRLHYDLACCESQLGDFASAKEHITRAFVLNEDCQTRAMDDPDLKPLWDSMQTRLW
jgi:predicted Zn-dependent protease